jgi:beta-glucanase (GH16 family)
MSGTLDLSGYQLTYDDEFNSFTSTPDGSHGYQTTFYFGGRSLPSNGELEYYSDSTVGVNPFSLANGALTITAAPGTNPENLPYNSGLITTEGMFTQTYGYFEARIEAAQGAGMWNGFWMLPADKSWPPEIDIMEAFGADNGRGEGGAFQNHVNSITSDYSTGGGGAWVPTTGNIYTGYHTYGVNWQPDYTTFYMDGQEVYRVATPSEMNKPMYMLVQLAVGGPWVGNPTGETGQIKVDYIRAYSNSATATAVSLGTISSPDAADTSNLHGATAGDGTVTHPGTLTLRVSEDAWSGDAQFTVSVDGVRLGDVYSATASHKLGQWQDIALTGNFATSGAHTVSVTFINDGWGGTTDTDRNLYVQSVTINGETISGALATNNAANGGASMDPSAAVMQINGTATFSALGIPSDTITTAASYTLDGTTHNLTLIGSAAINGTGNALDNTLTGNVANNALAGGTGSDTLIGHGGNDTYIFNLGDGHDTIVNGLTNGSGASGTLAFGAGIDASHLWRVISGADLVFQVLGTSDRITITDWYLNGNNQLGQITLADGSHISTAAISQLAYDQAIYQQTHAGFDPATATVAPADALAKINADWGISSNGINTINGTGGNDSLVGGTADDTINAGLGNDTLDGKGGNDTLNGGGGNDTYNFGLGYGHDTIVNGLANGSGASGTLAFGAGIDAAHLWRVISGADLVFQVLGTSDRITITDWYLNGNNQLGQITLADGSHISTAAISQLAHDQAVYQQTHAGFDPATATIAPADALAAIKADWGIA